MPHDWPAAAEARQKSEKPDRSPTEAGVRTGNRDADCPRTGGFVKLTQKVRKNELF